MKNKIAFITLGLLTLSLAGCGTTMSVYPDADKYTAGNVLMADIEVKKIDIDWISGSVTLVEDENAVGVDIREETTLTDEKALVHSYYHDGILSVKYFASGYWCRQFNYKKDLTITYKPGLDSLKVDLTSGSLNADNLHAQDFDLDLTSGSVNIKYLVADDVDIDLTSGSVNIEKLNTKNFDADLTSGKVGIGFEAVEKATFELTSGTINMGLPTDGGTVKVTKTSGKVVANRECTINENAYKFGSGTADIRVKMTSGTLTID